MLEGREEGREKEGKGRKEGKEEGRWRKEGGHIAGVAVILMERWLVLMMVGVRWWQVKTRTGKEKQRSEYKRRAEEGSVAGRNKPLIGVDFDDLALVAK